ncbi:MAG: TonB-dependent receptor [Verrucomicrobia bacterium]|nr:TonB-dependent receptor [Verrucomicrobiota bacterium]
MEDTGALTVREALQFTAGLETNITSVQPGENPNPNSFRLRGFVSQAVLRNGFRREGSTDTINIAQVDVVRGPNALLYGIGNFGGVVNYVTRDPVDEFRYTSQVVVGSNQFYRATFDATGPLMDGLAFRLPMFVQTSESWFDNYEQDRWGIAPVVVYKPTQRTRISFETEYFFTNTKSPENPLASGLRSDDFYDFIDTTLHPGNQGFLAYPSREFRYVGAGATYNRQQDMGVLGTISHIFSDTLGFNGGAYWARTKNEGRSINFNLSPIADINVPTSIVGRRNRSLYPWAYLQQHEMYDEWALQDFYALQYNWGQFKRDRTRVQVRGEFAWKPTFLGLDHSFLAGMSYDNLVLREHEFIFADTNRPIQNVGLQPYPIRTSAFARYHSVNNFSPITFEPGPTEGFFPTRDPIRSFIAWSRGYYLIHQTSFWDNKFRTISGIRYDRFQIGREGAFTAADSRRATSPDPINNPEGGDLSLVGTALRQPNQNETKKFNYSFGLSYTPIDPVSMFVLTASALDPETTGGQRGPTGLVPDPQLGQSYEFGVKVDILDRRISASMSVYQINRENVAVSQSHPGANVRTGESIVPPSDIANPDSPSFSQLWVDQGRAAPGTVSLREDQSRGFDSQLFLLDLVPGFETIIGFSYNKYRIRDHRYWIFNEVVDASGNLVDYQFDQVSALAYRDETGTPVPWLESRLNNDTPEFTFRLWNKYTFRDGPLEGFDIGVGVSWSDRREATLSADDQGSYKVIPDRTSVSLALGYKRNFSNFDLNLRLNISNLLNDDKVYGYAYTEPRSFRLTATVNF